MSSLAGETSSQSETRSQRQYHGRCTYRIGKRNQQCGQQHEAQRGALDQSILVYQHDQTDKAEEQKREVYRLLELRAAGAGAVFKGMAGGS